MDGDDWVLVRTLIFASAASLAFVTDPSAIIVVEIEPADIGGLVNS